jgi:RNA polymerase sigma-70 factor (ECF subfamily)
VADAPGPAKDLTDRGADGLTPGARRLDGADMAELVDAAKAGDQSALAQIVDRFRPELQLHCYRMLGSLDDAEDTMQDVWLQVWRSLDGFEGRATVRTWLYRIATNACLARRTRAGRRRRILAAGTVVDGAVLPITATVPWLQPCPDELLDQVAARQPEPADQLTARETVEIAFVAALQHLPPRQRAALVLRDVVGWPVERCAAELDTTVAAINSALQRARAALRDRLGHERTEWPARASSSDLERSIVRRYIAAIEASDDEAIAALLREDAIVSHQPGAGGNDTDHAAAYVGRSTILDAWAPALHSPIPLEMRMVEVWANRQPAVASYIRLPGAARHRAFGLSLLRLDPEGLVTEVANFTPDVFAAHGLPLELPEPAGPPVT